MSTATKETSTELTKAGRGIVMIKRTVLGGILALALTFGAAVSVAAEPEEDLVAPVVTITTGPEGPTSVTQAQISFTVDDETAVVECRFDTTEESGWAACASPFQVEDLVDGDHVLEVRATDPAANVSDVARHEWKVDTTAPVVTISDSPAASSNSINASFIFEANEPEVDFQCRLDPANEEAEWNDCESPVAYSNLDDGPHRFEVRATDLAGNTGTVVVHEWEVTTVKPVAEIVSGPTDPTAAEVAEFELVSDNPNATFECRLDPAEESTWTDCSSPVVYNDLTHGGHRFEVRAVEADQGVGPVASFEWTVDIVTPSVELTGTPEAISGTTDPVFGFIADEEGTTAECRLDPTDPSDPWVACVSPTAFTALTEGPHRFEVRVTDPVGHVSEAAHYEWVIETTQPTATLESGPESTTTEISAKFSFSKDNPNAYFECRLDAGDWSACESGITFGQLADGNHQFEVRAVGYGAGAGPIASQSWVIDTLVPTMRITSGPATPTNETAAEFSFESNKPGFSFRCQLDAEAAGLCTSPLDLSGLSNGDHSLMVELVDSNDQVVDSSEWQWKILADRPVATITAAPAAASSVATAVFEFEADVAEAGFECKVDNGNWSGCTSPAAFSGLADGDHTFSLRAGLNGSSPGAEVSHGWSVDTVAPDLRITGGPGQFTKSDVADFGIVTDGAVTVSCLLDSGSWAACSGTVALTGLADGDHVLRVRAVDEAGNTSFARYDWTVDSTAPLLVTLGTVPAASTTETLARFGFTADDPQSGYECRLDGGAWKACTSTHEVQVKIGAHEFEVRGSDRLGNVSEPVTHRWEVTGKTVRGLVPTVRFKRKAKLNTIGSTKIAVVNCPEGRCRVIAPRRITIKVGGRKFKATILATRGFYSEPKTEIRVASLAKLRNLLRKSKQKAKLKIKVSVDSDNGKSRTLVKTVRLTAK